MKKIIKGQYTTVVLEDKEPEEICKLGQGPECCAFLVVGPDGFECCKMDILGNNIRERLLLGSMIAEGAGEWEGCPWHA